MLEYMLLRRPDEFGLAPWGEWYRLKDVLKVLAEEGQPAREKHIRELNHLAVSEGREPAFILEDGLIRSSQGQPPQPLALEEPPVLLFGFCRRRAHAFVLANGLRPGQGERVVLAESQDQALAWGRRLDPEPVPITVEALRASQEGVSFERLGETVYLAPELPPHLLRLPPLPQEKPREHKPEPAKAAPSQPFMPAEDDLPGSFRLRLEPEDQTGAGRGPRKKSWQKERRRQRRRKMDGF